MSFYDPSRHTTIRTVKGAALVVLVIEVVFGFIAADNAPTGRDVSTLSVYAGLALGAASLVILPFVTNARTRDHGYTRGVMVAALLIYQLTGAVGLALSWVSNDPVYVGAFGLIAALLTLLTPPAYR